MKRGLIGGAIGAIILATIMFAMFIAELGNVPGFVGIQRRLMGENMPLNYILGTVGFIVAGGILGAIYSLVIKKPSVISAMLFGFAPTFFVWLVISPLMSGKVFNGFAAKGLIFPIIFNVLIWGSFTGWFLSKEK